MEDAPTPADSPRAPVAVLAGAFGLLLLVLVVIILRPSTAPEPEPPAPTGRAPVVTAAPESTLPADHISGRGDPAPGTTLLLGDVDRIRALMAEGFEEDYAPHISPGEADCLAGAVLEVLGADRLLLLTEAMIEASGDPGNVDENDPALITPAEEGELDGRMRHCVDEETASRLNL